MMSEYERLYRLAIDLREKYPPGTRLELIHMEDKYAPVESGTRGTVRHIDDMAQIHMLWDNGRTLPINVDTDKFRVLSPAECIAEQYERKAKTFLEVLNKDILASVDWDALGESYQSNDFDYSKEVLLKMHNAFVECYGTDELNSDMDLVTVPAVLFGKDSQICLALLDIDTCSSGEHWGTAFLTPHGIYQQGEECHHKAQEYASAMCPYKYWYTVKFSDDIHVELDNCPDDIRTMIEEVSGDNIGQNGGIQLE